MHVIVIGSGVIGTTSAYYLAKQGHDVTVIDRQPGSSLETSFANAGQVSPGYAAPWAAPGIPWKAVKWMFSEHSPLIINPRMDWQTMKFMARMLRNCTQSRYDINKSRMLRLAEYSRQAFGDLNDELGLAYDHGKRGTLQLFRTDKQVKAAEEDQRILDKCAVPYEALDADACVAAEPALEDVKHKLKGGLRLPLDETGDCFRFSDELTARNRTLGVQYRFNTTITALNQKGGTITSIETDKGTLTADAYVMALGSYSPLLLTPLGIDIPVYPVKGYSLTIPVTNPDKAPVSTIMDETHKVAVTRLGDRIRVAGTAELTGYNLDLKPARRKTVEHVVRDLYPQGGDLSQAEFWTGLRPMTPDGTPVVGPTGIDNLFLNTGHGTLGWTMSCGSGRLLADVISNRQPEISIEGLTADRYESDFTGQGRSAIPNRWTGKPA